jgi:two-component system, OmpR family, phosphate regulon sensor histidine kinase PhoR
MVLDYTRLVDGLNASATMVNAGGAGLPVVTVLITAAQDATGAVGATFTQYDPGGGRCVAATGDMMWALGQPISAEFVDPAVPARPWVGRVADLPVQIAEPLAGRGLLAMAGHPVQSAARALGAVHVYFADANLDRAAEVLAAVGAVAHAVAQLYSDRAPSRPLAEDDADRDLFLEVAGHELRTPATVIKGYAGTLADRWTALTESDRQEAVRVLAHRADELARLVDRLFAAAGVPASAWLTAAVPFDLSEAIARAVAELPDELRRAVRVELPNGLPLAYGDPASLPSVVAELVTNAVRHSGTQPDGGADGGAGPEPAGASPSPGAGTVELRAGADKASVYLQVGDRGVGIDPEHVERAFERFWQAGLVAQRRGGVGLGLYLVRRLVERQNGWVSLRPREGGGTVAEVRLPRADGPVRPPVSGEA